MPDRQIDYGEDETDAAYRSGDAGGTEGGGNFVVAELLGDRVLMEWDQTAEEWVVRGPVDMDGRDVSNVGSLSATEASVENAPVDATGVARLSELDEKVDLAAYPDIQINGDTVDSTDTINFIPE